MKTQKIKFPLPEKKLYHVEISIVERQDDDSFGENRMRKESVIARTASEAMSKIKLMKNKDLEEFFSGVTLVSEIDVL